MTSLVARIARLVGRGTPDSLAASTPLAQRFHFIVYGQIPYANENIVLFMGPRNAAPGCDVEVMCPLVVCLASAFEVSTPTTLHLTSTVGAIALQPMPGRHLWCPDSSGGRLVIPKFDAGSAVLLRFTVPIRTSPASSRTIKMQLTSRDVSHQCTLNLSAGSYPRGGPMAELPPQGLAIRADPSNSASIQAGYFGFDEPRLPGAPYVMRREFVTIESTARWEYPPAPNENDGNEPAVHELAL